MKNHFVYALALITLIGISGCAKNGERDKPTALNKVLLISFDGFRYDYLDKVETPHFDSLISEGVQSEGLIPVFPSKTFPNHYSIATGLHPKNTGFVNNTMYDPKWDEWYKIRDRKAVENGKWYGGEPIWNTLEKQGVRTGTMFWVGSEADIQGMYPAYWKPYNEQMPERARIDTVLKWMTKPDGKDVDFGTLYFSHVDTKGHWYGTESDSLKEALRRSDQLIGYLKKRMQEENLWQNTNVIILSDHGMVDLSGDKVIRLDEIINLEDAKRIIWDPMTMIAPKEGKKEELYQALKSAEKNYRVYKKEQLPERYHLKNSRRVEDIVMVADLEYSILSSDYKSDFIESLPRGDHGFDNQNKEMQALFVARGPDFKNGLRVSSFQNIHVYELINYLMGTNPAPNDGSLDSVRVLLN